MFEKGLEHVPRYHEWMKDPALLEATGSEPLSIEEEIKMQESWRDDPKKCTFIVHVTEVCNAPTAPFSVPKNLVSMVGDVNLFLSDIENDNDEDDNGEDNGPHSVDVNKFPQIQAEIDIMIAEQDYQKKGIGRAATCAMILYGAKRLGIQRFFCKINDDNIASLRLFKSLGFVQCDYAECFKQVELELKLPLDDLRQRLEPHGIYQEVPCPIDAKP